MDGVELEILWSNLIGIVTDRAKALQRIAFSPVVREAGDLACALFDRRGRMVAQANTGTPGHINSLAIAGAHLVRIFANNLKPGDVIITNDPWLSAGHFFDITVLSPIFAGDRILAYIGSTIHHTDIGGYGIGAGARDVHEEGLWIPPLKLYNAGEPCPVLHALIKQNARTPDAVFGDLAAQVSSGQTASERLIAMCQRYGLIDIEGLSDEIISRSEAATRAAISKLERGTFHGQSRFDVPGGQIVTLKAAVTIDPDAGEVLVDFAGSTPQTESGINVVLNYTHAYATFAIRSCLNPELPNNTGSLTPINVHAPEGSILNCKYPAPVAARHVVGMYVPMPILKALHHVMPDRVLAEGSGAVWTMQIQGERADGRPFTSSMFSYSGGMGARATKTGPSATCYPTGVAAVPVEIIEAVTPVIFDCKELRPNSGGDGAVRGGDGQIIQFRLDTRDEWLLNTVASRVDEGPEGLGGGRPGAPGKFQINGKPVRDHKKLTMQPGYVVLFETPGGGGYGHRQTNTANTTQSLSGGNNDGVTRAPAAPGGSEVTADAKDLHKIDWESIPWEPVREGIVRKAFSGNGATLALHKLMPKHEPKPHKHTYEQIVYILAGHIRFHVGDKSIVLGPGGLLQIPPDVMHWGEVVGDEPVLNLDIFTPVREEYAPAP